MSSLRKCTNCKEEKSTALFAKHPKHGFNLWCKECINFRVKQLRDGRKETHYLKWKAYQLRSNWIRRAKAYGITPNNVPKALDILSWLESQKPFKCYYTGIPLEETSFGVDHKVSIFHGGSFSLDNLAITCPRINGAKGDLSSEEFLDLLKLIDTWEDKGQRLLHRLLWSNTRFKGGKN